MSASYRNGLQNAFAQIFINGKKPTEVIADIEAQSKDPNDEIYLLAADLEVMKLDTLTASVYSEIRKKSATILDQDAEKIVAAAKKIGSNARVETLINSLLNNPKGKKMEPSKLKGALLQVMTAQLVMEGLHEDTDKNTLAEVRKAFGYREEEGITVVETEPVAPVSAPIEVVPQQPEPAASEQVKEFSEDEILESKEFAQVLESTVGQLFESDKAVDVKTLIGTQSKLVAYIDHGTEMQKAAATYINEKIKDHQTEVLNDMFLVYGEQKINRTVEYLQEAGRASVDLLRIEVEKLKKLADSEAELVPGSDDVRLFYRAQIAGETLRRLESAYETEGVGNKQSHALAEIMHPKHEEMLQPGTEEIGEPDIETDELVTHPAEMTGQENEFGVEKNAFDDGDSMQPIAFNPSMGLYTLPNDATFEISLDDVGRKIIDVKTGYLLDDEGKPTGEFPIVRIVGGYQSDEKLRARESKLVGGNIELGDYYGKILTPEEVKFQFEVDMALSHYFRSTTKRQLNKPINPALFNISTFRQSYSRENKHQLIDLIREGSEKEPLNLVVSSSGKVLGDGFDEFGAFLDRRVKPIPMVTDPVIIEIIELHASAAKAFRAFESQKQSPKNARKILNPNHWDAYIKFFERLQSAEVAEAFGTDNLRALYFPSDLDGETAIYLFEQAGITTRVTPFMPDSVRNKGAYIPGAVHLDITHGKQGLYRAENEDVASVFLDEDNKKIRSSTEATLRQLKEMGFFDGDLPEEMALRDYLQMFVSEEDSFTGPYESREGTRAIIENYDRNIYGFGNELAKLGFYDVVVKFFRTVLPEVESKILADRPELGDEDKREQLRQEVLRRFVTLDVRPYLGDIDLEKTKEMTHELGEQVDASLAAIRLLERDGFVGETRFGKTLFDPHKNIKLQGRAAFAAGYDCYVSYNASLKTAVINLAPFNKADGIQIPERLYIDEKGRQIGEVIKNGRYLVTNSSSATFKNFEQVVTAVMQNGDQTFESPKGVAEYIADENADIAEGKVGKESRVGKKRLKFSGEIFGSMRKIEKPLSGEEGAKLLDEQKRLALESCAPEVQKTYEDALQRLNRNHSNRYGEDGRKLRETIVKSFTEIRRALHDRMKVENDNEVYKHLERYDEDMDETIYDDAEKTMLQMASAPPTDKIRTAYEQSKFFGTEKFWLAYRRAFIESSGLIAYRDILAERREELDELWLRKLQEVWGLKSEKAE
ncbi:MAG: hypothetical protein NT003_03160 [Candidatus Magasanikbacteria bacterium]|nr:hypothetical protein [Candidatus Magasanikbacteria bacterium]